MLTCKIGSGGQAQKKCCTSFLNTFMRLLYNHDVYAYSLHVLKIANKISPTCYFHQSFFFNFTYYKNVNQLYEMKHLVRSLKLRPSKKFQYNAYSKKTSDFVGQVYARTFYMVEQTLRAIIERNFCQEEENFSR